MNVLYDHQTFSLQDYGGISRIYAELLKSSSNYPEFNAELSILFSNNEYLKEVNNLNFLNFIKRSQWKYKSPLMMKMNMMQSISKLKASKFDVFHPTYYHPYFLKYLKGKPFVVTFLDMIHEKFGYVYPELANEKVILNGKKLLMKSANKVIAISQSTKNDIINLYGVDPNKIEVIYLGSSMPKALPNSKAIVKENYIFFVGKRGYYKNFSFFLNSISDVLLTTIILVCAGGGKFTIAENEQVIKLNLQNRIRYIPIDNDDTLVNLYTHAQCFVFPSLYEGFGIPILEAFSCGCPCIISNRSSFPEVGGDAAIYFNPEDANSINVAILLVLNNKRLQNDLVKRGYERLKLFSWDKMRTETFKLYASVL